MVDLVVAAFARDDANCLLYLQYKDPAIASQSGMCGSLNDVHGLGDQPIIAEDLDLRMCIEVGGLLGAIALLDLPLAASAAAADHRAGDGISRCGLTENHL